MSYIVLCTLSPPKGVLESAFFLFRGRKRERCLSMCIHLFMCIYCRHLIFLLCCIYSCKHNLSVIGVIQILYNFIASSILSDNIMFILTYLILKNHILITVELQWFSNYIALLEAILIPCNISLSFIILTHTVHTELCHVFLLQYLHCVYILFCSG